MWKNVSPLGPWVVSMIMRIPFFESASAPNFLACSLAPASTKATATVWCLGGRIRCEGEGKGRRRCVRRKNYSFVNSINQRECGARKEHTCAKFPVRQKVELTCYQCVIHSFYAGFTFFFHDHCSICILLFAFLIRAGILFERMCNLEFTPRLCCVVMGLVECVCV